VLDYNREAARYDATRGGDERADAAAAAIRKLIPAGAATVLDIACGTGIVTMRLTEPRRRVIGVDRAEGMLALAQTRLPGAVLCGDATKLPMPDDSVDAVVIVWLLQLLGADQVEAAIAEVARVLRPRGTLITTVDRNDAAYAAGSDTTNLVGPVRAQFVPRQRDTAETITKLAKAHRLAPAGEATFVGHGQGRSPQRWIEVIRAFDHDWPRAAGPDIVTALLRQLAALPDQDIPRADPVYRLLALHRT